MARQFLLAGPTRRWPSSQMYSIRLPTSKLFEIRVEFGGCSGLPHVVGPDKISFKIGSWNFLWLTVLADVVELKIAVGVGPEPTLGAVKASTVVGARGKVPEGDGHRLPIDPLPVERVKLVSLGTQPVLTIGISSVSPPELPREKTL